MLVCRSVLMAPRGVVAWCMLVALPGVAEPASESAASPAIAATQVTLQAQRVEFQGTIIARSDNPARLTVATAAHGLFPLGEGTAVALRTASGASTLRAVVVAATPNPGYKPIRSRDRRASLRFQGAIGSDNSVVTLTVSVDDDAARGAFEALRVARVAARPIPPRAGVSVLTVRVVDRNGVEHTVKGSTAINPKWLAWGPSYHPRPGDSGAGVFAFVNGTSGASEPILIGNVVASDEGGGIAALFSTSEFPALEPVKPAASAARPTP